MLVCFEDLFELFFGFVVVIDVGGVEEGDFCIECGVDYCVCIFEVY